MKVVRRLDQLDLEAFREVMASAPFQRMVARWRAERARAMERCTCEVEEVALRRAQGAVQAWDTVLGLPDVMMAEIRNQAKG